MKHLKNFREFLLETESPSTGCKVLVDDDKFYLVWVWDHSVYCELMSRFYEERASFYNWGHELIEPKFDDHGHDINSHIYTQRHRQLTFIGYDKTVDLEKAKDPNSSDKVFVKFELCQGRPEDREHESSINYRKGDEFFVTGKYEQHSTHMYNMLPAGCKEYIIEHHLQPYLVIPPEVKDANWVKKNIPPEHLEDYPWMTEEEKMKSSLKARIAKHKFDL